MEHFPKLLRQLPPFKGPFDAFKLEAKNCDVLSSRGSIGSMVLRG